MRPLSKTFILTQFGKPHSWTQEFIDSVQFLAPEYQWLIFTPNDLETKGNVKIMPMDIETFNVLVEKKLGFNPQIEIIEGIPSKPLSDFFVASGVIFEDFIKTAFWGITNWDVVYGRLDHFVPEDFDIFSDDINTINGVFSLFRNNEYINNLFRKIPYWEKHFQSPQISGTDEYLLTDVVRKEKLKFVYPLYSPFLSHDRLENHVPDIKLKRMEDNSLWELLNDTKPVHGLLSRPSFAREILLFHFQRSKQWPNIA